jgi:hypothetical protein
MMSKFVFRNNTLESFFDKGFQFSGYDDISCIPQDVDEYIWWYQIPIKFDSNVLAEEVRGYARKIVFVLGQIDKNKPFVALTIA